MKKKEPEYTVRTVYNIRNISEDGLIKIPKRYDERIFNDHLISIKEAEREIKKEWSRYPYQGVYYAEFVILPVVVVERIL